MTYKVKKIYHTVQGEGINAGMPAVFVRFAGCNLWNGREDNREYAVCRFCDTDFVGGERLKAHQVVSRIGDALDDSPGTRLIVLTGGEPMLQVDEDLIKALRGLGRTLAVETNGTIKVPEGWFDHITVSPKRNAEFVQFSGTELKVVHDQGFTPLLLEKLERLDFKHFLLQPCDDDKLHYNLNKCINFVKQNPKWRLSVQTHKYPGMEWE